MNKYISAILLLVVLQFSVQAQNSDTRSETTRIADLLALQPALTANKLQDAFNQLEKFTPDNIAALLAQLQPAGKSNNSKITYIANSYSYTLLQPGKDAARNRFVEGTVKALGRIQDNDNKAFLISLLQQAGKDEAVPALRNLLTDNYLGEKAAHALASIKSAAAGRAVLEAFPTLTGNNRIAAIQALGFMELANAEKTLIPLAGTGDAGLNKPVYFALANITGAASEKVLATAAHNAGYIYEPSEATAAYLRYINNLVKKGSKPQATKLAKSVFDATQQEKQLHTHIAALQILTDINPQAQVGTLIKAAQSGNSVYRNAAFNILKPFANAGIMNQLLASFKNNDENVQADLVRFAGITKATAALPILKNALQHKSPTVVSEAIKSYAVIAGAQAIPELLKVLNNNSENQPIAQAVKTELLQLKGASLPGLLTAALPKAAPGAQVVLTEVLAARASTQSANAIVALVKSTNPAVQTAAYNALPRVATQLPVANLLNLLTTAPLSSVKPVKEAIINAVKSGKDVNTGVETIITGLNQAASNTKAGYFDILAGIGSARALTAVTGSLNADSRTEAITALTNWSDAGALPQLTMLSRNAKDAAQLDAIIKGIVRLNNMDVVADEQKVLVLRDAFSVAQTPDQKKLILRNLESAKTYNALLFAGQFLYDDALKQTAGNTVMNIALANKGFYGAEVTRLLKRVLEVLSGSESSYLREAIQKHLGELPAGPGFVTLFNGKDLAGWKGLVANPVKRSQMDAATLATAQEKADEVMRKGWEVKNGELVFSGKGDNIVTQKQYGDFEMLVDWKLDANGKEGDAGIYLRGSPQVQIWDTSRRNVGAQVGSGGLYNNKKNASKPLKVADNKLGEWNTFRILMTGDKVTVYLNGELVTDNVVLENYWDAALPIFAKEQIELQAHGTEVYYRDIFIREIPRKEIFTLSKAEQAEGFELLFDGTNLDKWAGNTDAYRISDEGTLAIYPTKGSGGNFYTKEEFSDFVYRFEFRLTPGANNGVGIRTPPEGDAAYVGMEIQVLDDGADIYKNLEQYQYHGSVYGIIAAKRGYLKPVGEWNTEEIRIQGNKITVTLNGTVIVDGDLAEATKNGTLDGKQHPGLQRKGGHIAFLGHGSEVHFKNIRVKRL